MTKEEFDNAFRMGLLCVHHDTQEEFLAVHDYGVQELGLTPAIFKKEHDVKTYPYVYCSRSMSIDALRAIPAKGKSLFFEEFLEIIDHALQDKLMVESLDTVL